MNKLELFFGNPLRIEVGSAPPPSPGVVQVSSTTGGVTVTAKGPRMAYTLPDDKQVLLQVEFIDAKGHHAGVDGDPAWSSSDTSVATVTVSPGNPFLATLAAGTSLGNAQVIVTADADMGDGMQEISCLLDVTVVAGSAVGGTISPASEPAPPSPGGG